MSATKLLYTRLMEYRSDLLQLRLALVMYRNLRVYITSVDVMWQDNFARHIVIRVCDGINRYTRQS